MDSLKRQQLEWRPNVVLVPAGPHLLNSILSPCYSASVGLASKLHGTFPTLTCLLKNPYMSAVGPLCIEEDSGILPKLCGSLKKIQSTKKPFFRNKCVSMYCIS